MMAYEKQRIAFRYWLLGAGFHKAAEAMAFAEHYHQGLRKDGVTPEFAHQVQIASHVRTLLPHLKDPEGSLCIALMHDTSEDAGVSDAEIRDQFGNFVADGVHYMTKEFRGVRRDDRELFKLMATHEGASVVKPADRRHNLASMVGVFSVPKMIEYIEETRELFFPMIKTARRNFPAQEPAYENLKLFLTGQLEMLDAIVAGASQDLPHWVCPFPLKVCALPADLMFRELPE